jgi:hypothetical protein
MENTWIRSGIVKQNRKFDSEFRSIVLEYHCTEVCLTYRSIDWIIQISSKNVFYQINAPVRLLYPRIPNAPRCSQCTPILRTVIPILQFGSNHNTNVSLMAQVNLYFLQKITNGSKLTTVILSTPKRFLSKYNITWSQKVNADRNLDIDSLAIGFCFVVWVLHNFNRNTSINAPNV